MNATIRVLGAWRLDIPDGHCAGAEADSAEAAAPCGSDGRIGADRIRGTRGQPRPVRVAVQRLLAFLVLRGRVQQRVLVAGSLWPDSSDRRASANLRSALWHARHECPGVVDGDGTTVWLSDGVGSDFEEAAAVVRDVLVGEEVTQTRLATLAEDVLPDWDDEWLRSVRFVHRQLRLLALERAAGDAPVTTISPRC